MIHDCRYLLRYIHYTGGGNKQPHANYLETPDDWSMFSSMPLLTHLNFGLNELTGDFLGSYLGSGT